jgi:hypothetical protein
MSSIPKTERGLRSRITRYRAELTREKRTYGGINDGRGMRYVIFWLLFLLDDPNESKKYIRWYAKEFDDDVGEPIHKLCLSLILHRIGNLAEAAYTLADLMLANQQFIPTLTGIPSSGLKQGRSSDASASYVEEIPSEILSAISEAEKLWMVEKYNSFVFRRLRKQYSDIETELDRTEVGPARTRLVDELYGLLAKHRAEITANNTLESDL